MSAERDSSSHYIEFAHVYKTFDTPVLADVSFHVDVGHTLAIIGRSGYNFLVRSTAGNKGSGR